MERATGHDVTIEQYKVGLDQMRSQATTARVMATTGLTKAQVRWCALVGDAGRGMPAWVAVLERELAVLRAQSLDVIADAGLKAANMIKRDFEIASQAQDAIALLHGTYVHDHLAVKLREAKATGTKADLDDLAMPVGMRETLKVLYKQKDVSNALKTIQLVYLDAVDSMLRGARSTGTSKEASKVLSPDAHLPAAVSLTEERQEAGGTDLDPLETLLGDDLERWAEDDFQDFVDRPREDFDEALKKYVKDKD
jgi:hypothetical protein